MRYTPCGGSLATRLRLVIAMYPFVLSLHSIVRWAALVLGAVVALQAIGGVVAGRPYRARGGRLARIFVAVVDLQLLIGLSLYTVLSPIARAAMQAPGAAMRSAGSRYWLLEHPLLAIVAVALAHLGQILAARAPDDARRWRRAAILFTLATAAIALAIPWPFLPQGRPLWPLGAR